MILRRKQLVVLICAPTTLFAACLDPAVGGGNGTADIASDTSTLDAVADVVSDAVPDVVPPPDVVTPPDAIADAGPETSNCLTPVVGTSCVGYEGYGLCDAEWGPFTVYCDSVAAAPIWVKGPYYDPDFEITCECYDRDECGLAQPSCPVIGYAGIGLAGFDWAGGRRLRQV